MANAVEIKKSINRLLNAYHTFKPDQEALKGFMEIVVEKLSPFPSFIIARAVEKIIETSQYFPRINELMCACFQERDSDMAELNNTLQSFKDDWYMDKLHTESEWKALEREYLKLGSKTTAAYVMSEYAHYGKPIKPVSKEQIDAGRKKLLEAMEAE